MIDPSDIVREYTDSELEELIIFCVLVAGKSASTIAPRLEKMNQMCLSKHKKSMFWFIANNGALPYYLKCLGIGCYTSKSKTLKQLVDKFKSGAIIRETTTDQLEEIYGIGPKTSRFFIMFHKKVLSMPH